MNKITYIIFFLALNISCQTTKSVTLNEVDIIKEKLSNFLLKKSLKLDKGLKKKSYKKVNLFGVHHIKINSKNMQEGVYGFSSTYSHSMSFFLIYENKKVTILDNSTSEGLLKSIEALLQFSERKKYCVDILNDYVARLIRGRYIINKNPRLRSDINCSKGIHSNDNLP